MIRTENFRRTILFGRYSSLLLLSLALFFLMPFTGAYAEKHPIERGETALQIAIDRNLTMEQLQQLNPGVDLEMMLVGDILIVPDEGESFESFLNKRYAEKSRINDLSCVTAADHSAICLFYIENLSEYPLYDVALKAEVRGKNGAVGTAETKIALMQVLPGEQLPVYIGVPGYFDDVDTASINVTNLSWSDLLQSSFRIPQEMFTRNVSLTADGIAAGVTVLFNADGAAACREKKINMLAAARDKDGRLVGIRSLYSDFYSRLDITVYSIGPCIETVDLYVEAY